MVVLWLDIETFLDTAVKPFCFSKFLIELSYTFKKD